MDPNEQLIDEIEVEQLEFDIRLTCLVNPFTALYVGYNTGYENFDEDPSAEGCCALVLLTTTRSSSSS